MSVRRWDPFAELMSMRQMMDRLFEESFGRTRRGLAERGGPMVMPVDVFETGDSYTIKAPLPGAKPEDVNISVSGNTISIRAEIKDEETVVPDNYLYQERALGSYVRDVELPAPVQADKAEARFENGLLILTVPKSEEAKPKQIKVRTQ